MPTWDGYVDDIRTLAGLVRAQHAGRPLLLMGHSRRCSCTARPIRWCRSSTRGRWSTGYRGRRCAPSPGDLHDVLDEHDRDAVHDVVAAFVLAQARPAAVGS
jgi:hypothetical protein